MDKRNRYVITYPNGKFLRIDSTSGYPFEAEDSPAIFYKEEDAESLKKMFPKEELEIWEMEYTLKEEGVTKEIEVFVDSTDFYHEIGAGNALGPHNIYNSIEEIKNKQPCANQCGIIRAKLIKLETVLLGDWKAKVHSLSLFEKYRLAEEALSAIANFTHKEDCESKEAPVYECGCYDKSQWGIAEEVLNKIKDFKKEDNDKP